MALDNDEISSIVQRETESALNHLDDNYQAERIKATEYYHGEPFGDEQDGKSQVVSRDVADVIDSAMPSLMRVFSSTDYVKFAPRSAEDEAAAEQASDLANYIVNVENGGFRLFHDWFKSALLYKVGVVRVSWQEMERVEEKSYEGLTQIELGALLTDDTVEIIEQTAEVIAEAVIDPDGATMMPAVEQFDVTIKRRVKSGKVVLDLIPPEEFLIDSRARSRDDARFMAHRTEVSLSDLIAMGYDADEIEEFSGGEDVRHEVERTARFNDVRSGRADDPVDDSQKKIMYQETYIRLDQDGDNIAETRRICSIGENCHILKNEITDAVPFAMLSPILMPHRAIGQGIAEKVFDIQRTKSALIRSNLDNLYQINSSRVLAQEGAVNLGDLMTNRPGSIVRVKNTAAVQPLPVQPIGREAMAMMNYMDHVKEQRTGLSKNNNLDADALQSTTAVAVQAQVNANAAHIELISRVFAETGVTDLFKLILRMVTTYQDQPKAIRIRNEFVQIDPRGWNPEMDVVVNVGLGTGQTQEKMAFLERILAKQEQILLQLGASNPLLDLEQYAATMQKSIEMGGFKDTRSFINPPNIVREKLAQQQQMAAQNGPKPDKDLQKMEMDGEIKRMELEAKAVQADKDAVQRAELDRRKAEMQAEIERFKANLSADVDRQRQEQQLLIDRERMEREFQFKMAELEAEKDLELIKMRAGSRDGQGNINLSD